MNTTVEWTKAQQGANRAFEAQRSVRKEEKAFPRGGCYGTAPLRQPLPGEPGAACRLQAEQELNCVLPWAKGFVSGTSSPGLGMIKYLPALSIIGTLSRQQSHFLSLRPGSLKSTVEISRATCLHSSATEWAFRCHLIYLFCIPKKYRRNPKATTFTLIQEHFLWFCRIS